MHIKEILFLVVISGISEGSQEEAAFIRGRDCEIKEKPQIFLRNCGEEGLQGNGIFDDHENGTAFHQCDVVGASLKKSRIEFSGEKKFLQLIAISDVKNNVVNVAFSSDISNIAPYAEEVKYKVTLTGEDQLSYQCYLKVKILRTNRKGPVITDLEQAITLRENEDYRTFSTFYIDDPDELGIDKVYFEKESKVFTVTKNETGCKSGNLESKCANGSLTLLQELDYETQTSYVLNVTAVDVSENRTNAKPQLSTFTLVHIIVEDVDDMPPEFTRPCSFIRFPEHTDKGTVLFTVQAIDGDRGINNTIGFRLLGDELSKKYLEVDSTTGDIRIKVSPDREHDDFANNGGILALQIQAYEIDKNNAEVFNRTTDNTCYVMVEDINDNPPKFASLSYEARVKENTGKGIPVDISAEYVTQVLDPDLGVNGTFNLTLGSHDANTFEITPQRGINDVTFLVKVLNNTFLDYDNPDYDKNISFKLSALEDINGKCVQFCGPTVVDITVYMEDENDNYPIFVEPIGPLSISENASAGDWVGNIQATDIDSAWFGTKGIRYRIMKSVISPSFLMEEVSGNITVSKDDHGFDREKIDEYYLTFEAQDNNGTGNRNSTLVQVKILDANDNAPQFYLNSYRAHLDENDKNFQDPLILQATDIDEPNTPNSEVRYQILDGPGSDLFQIDEKDGILTPVHPLDFENSSLPVEPDLNKTVSTRTFILEVEAYDLGIPRQASAVNVTIVLQDVNDNYPIFVQHEYEESILETTPQEKSVAMVTATDKDVSKAYNQVLYTIRTGDRMNFMINRTSGDIVVIGDIRTDRDDPSRNRYDIIVETMDWMLFKNESEIAQVTINIKHVNNKPPSFLQTKDTLRKIEDKEHENSSCIVNFTAVDRDISARLAYSIQWDESTVYAPSFTVLTNEDYDYQDRVLMNTTEEEKGCLSLYNVDREIAKQFDLVIAVEDQSCGFGCRDCGIKCPHVEKTSLTYIVLDINDHDPEFQSESYYGELPENRKGVPVVVVRATDVDENNTITYSLDGDFSSNGNFTVTVFGEIQVTEPVDFEIDQWKNFTVKATDSGWPPRTGQAPVTIKILDENDNVPQFVGAPYLATIEEEDPIGRYILTVNATDKDTEDYGLVYYRFLENVEGDRDKFSIVNRTGVVTSAARLDREMQSKLTFVIAAYDNPFKTGSGLSNQNITQPNVTLLDINDNWPEFIDKPSGGGCLSDILETAQIGSNAGRVQATDKDEGDNAKIYFNIVGGNGRDYFTIDSQKGDLKLAKEVKGLDEMLNITVRAEDHGRPRLHTQENFCISVKDVNLHEPEWIFPKDGYLVNKTILDNAEPPSKIDITLKAADKDSSRSGNGQVEFLLQDLSGGPAKGFFNLSQSTTTEDNRTIFTAEIILTKDAVAGSNITLNITICDKGTPKLCQEQKVTIKIKVLSYTENKPMFPGEKNINISVLEESNQCFNNITEAEYPTNQDSDNKKAICYGIAGDDKHLFKLEDVRETKICIGGILRREDKPTRVIKLRAYSTCKEDFQDVPHADELIMTIIVIDINNHPPKFRPKEIFAGVKVSDKLGDSIVEITAYDEDEEHNARFTITRTGNFKVNGSQELLNLKDNYFRVSEARLVKDSGLEKELGEVIVRKSDVIVNFTRLSSSMKGSVSFDVIAQDLDKEDFTDKATVSIYIVSEDQRIRFTIQTSITKFEEQKSKFISVLNGNIKGLTAVIDDYKESGSKSYSFSYSEQDEDAQNKKQESTEEIHVWVFFVKENENAVLDQKEAKEKVEKVYPSIHSELKSEGITLLSSEASNENEEKSDQLTPLTYILIGITAFLGFSLFVMLIIYRVQKTSLQRKLKASEASNMFGFEENEKQNDLAFVPNTNLHTIQGSNPIWSEDDDKPERLVPSAPNIEDAESLNSIDDVGIEYDPPPAYAIEASQNPLFIDEDSDDDLELAERLGITNYRFEEEAPAPLKPKDKTQTLRLANEQWKTRNTQFPSMGAPKQLNVNNLFYEMNSDDDERL